MSLKKSRIFRQIYLQEFHLEKPGLQKGKLLDGSKIDFGTETLQDCMNGRNTEGIVH